MSHCTHMQCKENHRLRHDDRARSSAVLTGAAGADALLGLAAARICDEQRAVVLDQDLLNFLLCLLVHVCADMRSHFNSSVTIAAESARPWQPCLAPSPDSSPNSHVDPALQAT